MFPDEEGTETRVEWVPPAWPYLVRRCSSMRRGLKRQSGTTKIRPPRTSSTMFPDEEGTETRREGEFLDPATPVRRCSPMRRGLKHDQNGKHHKRPRAFDDVPR